MEPNHFPQLLLIAGTGQNTGKTTLACQIIRKYSMHHRLIAVKITPHFYTDIQNVKVCIDEPDLFIGEETCSSTGKDSSLLLQAGARHSYFVMAKDERVGAAFQQILKIIPSGSLIICESGGLRSQVVPGIFLMMSNLETASLKPASAAMKLLADCVINFNGEKFDFDPDTIEISGNRWILKNCCDDTI